MKKIILMGMIGLMCVGVCFSKNLKMEIEDRYIFQGKCYVHAIYYPQVNKPFYCTVVVEISDSKNYPLIKSLILNEYAKEINKKKVTPAKNEVIE